MFLRERDVRPGVQVVLHVLLGCGGTDKTEVSGGPIERVGFWIEEPTF